MLPPEMLPPKPASRPDKVSFLRYMRLFRRDILSAQPEKLYRAWLAEFKTPFFRSYLVNQPDLVRTVLNDRPQDFPKSERVAEGLRPLLGNAVFVTNGEIWRRQRRIIDPAFEGGRLRDTFPAMWQAGEAAVARLTPGTHEIEEQASFAAADVIFRTLFSIPIEDEVAQRVFQEFRAYQRSQPILNLAAMVPLPAWMPRPFRRATRQSAQSIRALITGLTQDRMQALKAGQAPDDLATKIMTTPDPETGQKFSTDEMVDQVAIFFLAGHETSASTLAWALYLLAMHPQWQAQLAQEAEALDMGPDVAVMSKLRISRDVFREALRLYPPVPMMVRQATCPEQFRDKQIKPGAQMVISPWHLHRHTRLWDNPDGFDPARWGTANGQACMREAFIPFSSGSRVCPGAGFAMFEGPLLLSMLVRRFRFETVQSKVPVPQAHLTVRARDGIWLKVSAR